MRVSLKFLAKAALCVAFATMFCQIGLAQGTTAPDKTGKSTVQNAPAVSPKVVPINIDGLKKLLKPNGKPLLVNFWATWCDPCRDEFPDLVKLDTAYRGKIDFVTVSLDDLADIDTYVPKFLVEMKAEMPAFLLHTPDESAAITMVSKDWNGNLPLTILFSPNGDTAYLRKGKIRYDAAIAEINKLLATPPAN
jgi:thiol-disulfide isomerase/thioredoxin